MEYILLICHQGVENINIFVQDKPIWVQDVLLNSCVQSFSLSKIYKEEAIPKRTACTY